MTSIIPLPSLVVLFFERINPILIGLNIVLGLPKPLPVSLI